MKFSDLEFSFEIYGYFHNIYLIYKLLFITNCYSKFTKNLHNFHSDFIQKA